jgi:uncharacterized protein YjiS (DUF1127 family)
MNAKWLAGIGALRLAGAAHAPAPGAARRHERPGESALAGAAAAWGRGLETLRLWRQRAIGRRELARMDEVMLKDIGLGRAVARHEAAKHFWEA